MTHTGAFHYVRWDDIETFHKRGWMVIADLGHPHGQYAVLMWRCDCGEVS
jgi:hypothetical protein